MAEWWEEYEKTPEKPRSLWQRFTDNFLGAAAHNQLGAATVTEKAYDWLDLKKRKGESEAQHDARIKAAIKSTEDRSARRNAADPAFRGSAQSGLVKGLVDLAGGALGGVDPTYAIAPGATAAERILAQGAVNASAEVANQSVRIARDLQDEYDPTAIAINLATGVGVQGAGEAARAGRQAYRGSRRSKEARSTDRALMPVQGRITSGFGYRKAPKAGASTNHGGVDIAAPVGTRVLAPAAGRVTRVGRGHGKRGNWVEIEHPDGTTSRYLHLQGFSVKPGDIVGRGDVFAKSGATGNVTGPHLHWSLFKDGKAINPLGHRFADARASGMEEVAAASEAGPRVLRRTQREYGLDDESMAAMEAAARSGDNAPDNVVQFPVQQKAAATEDPYRLADYLTPTERQDLDASVPEHMRPAPLDNAHEKFTPYMEPKSPANDLDPLKSFKIRRDNPGDDWELSKQRRADEAGHTYQGAVTANTVEPIEIPTSFLRTLKGAMNEDPKPGSVKYDRLQKSVDEKGWEPDHPILIRINHRGEGYILEGNNRVAVADANGIPNVKAEVQWINGGEKTKLSPKFFKNLINMLKDERGSLRLPKWFYKEKKTADPSEGYKGDDPKASDASPAVQKLIGQLGEARTVRRKQEKQYSKERSERLVEIAQAQKHTSGEAGFYVEKSKLKGEMQKVDFESIRNKFEQSEIDELFDIIKDTNHLTLFDKMNARTGLAKLLSDSGGRIPTNSELALLEDVFPKDLLKNILKHKSLGKKMSDFFSNAASVPRSMMASMDLSAPFRQGLFMIARKEFWKAWGEMFRSFGSEKAFKAAQDDIRNRPTYKMMRRAGLALSDTGKILEQREEQFVSEWADKIPLVRASNRAYVAFLNKVRADVFDNLVKNGKQMGVNFNHEDKALRDIARYINVATGRGNLSAFGHDLNAAAPALASAFFSPRLMASRIAALNPMWYASLHPIARKEAIKSLLSTGLIVSSLLGLAAAGGADVETDPRSSDFAKIKIGKTRFDIAGGFQQYIKAAVQIVGGEKKNAKGEVVELGKGFGSNTRWDTFVDFFRGKSSPIASFFIDMMDGKNIIGEPFDVGIDDPTKVKSYVDNDIIQRFVPLFMQDLEEAWSEYGAAGLLTGIPAFFGVGVSTYGPREGTKTYKNEGKSDTTGDNWWKDFEAEDGNPASTDNWWKDYEG